MATATRLNSITYGPTGSTLKVGEGTSYYLHDASITSHAYETFGVEFTVVFTAASEAALLVLEQALIDAYRTPNGDLTITRGGSNWVAWTQAGNDGMNARPELRELPSHRSNHSRAFFCRISLLRPADETGKNFRQDSSVSVDTDAAGTKFLAVQARYTASTGSTAYENAETNFPTYLSTIQSVLTGTWETSDTINITYDDENKIADVSAQRQELIHDQSASGTDDANVDGITYTIRVFRDSTPQLAGSGALDFVMSSVEFSAPVRKSETTDLDTFVVDTIVPYLSILADTESDAPSTPMLANLDYSLEPMSNRVSGVASFRHRASGLIRASMRITDQEFLGNSLVPVADGGDGFTYDLHKSPRIRIRTIFLLAVELGTRDLTTTSRRPFDDAVKASQKEGYVLLERPQDTRESFELAAQNYRGDRFVFTESVISAKLQLVKQLKASGRTGQTRKGAIPKDAQTPEQMRINLRLGIT